MMQNTFTHAQLLRLSKRGADWLVICAHDIGPYRAGEVVSWHKKHDPAQRAARMTAQREGGERQYMRVVDIMHAINAVEINEQPT